MRLQKYWGKSHCRTWADITLHGMQPCPGEHSQPAPPQGARTAITEKCCSGSKTLSDSSKRQQPRREEAAPVGGTRHS